MRTLTTAGAAAVLLLWVVTVSAGQVPPTGGSATSDWLAMSTAQQEDPEGDKEHSEGEGDKEHPEGEGEGDKEHPEGEGEKEPPSPAAK